MASKTREDRIIHAVPCSECGAKVGELCRLERNTPPTDPAKFRPRLHTGRRLDWQQWKLAHPEPK